MKLKKINDMSKLEKKRFCGRDFQQQKNNFVNEILIKKVTGYVSNKDIATMF